MLSDNPRSTGRDAAYRSRLRSPTRRAAAADGLLTPCERDGSDVTGRSGGLRVSHGDRTKREESRPLRRLNYLSDLVFRSHRAVTQFGGLSRVQSPTTSASPPRSAAGRRARRAGSCCNTWTTSSGAAISCSARASVRRQARTGPRSASRVLRCEPVERARRTGRGTWDRTVATDNGVGRGLSAGREPGRGRDRAPLQPRGETSCTT
jgi:hypothetical protein